VSPALFAIYIDDFIVRLKAPKLWCHLNGAYYGCLLYANDILLLSHSVQTMRYILDVCDSYAIDYDVKFNCEKSAAPSTGPRHCYSCAELTLSGKPLVYITSIKYLGVYVTSAKRFKCSYGHVKLTFYRALMPCIIVYSRCCNSE